MFTLQSSPPPYPLLWLRGLFSWPCAAITRRDPLILKSLLSKFVDLKGVTRPFPGGFILFGKHFVALPVASCCLVPVLRSLN